LLERTILSEHHITTMPLVKIGMTDFATNRGPRTRRLPRLQAQNAAVASVVARPISSVWGPGSELLCKSHLPTDGQYRIRDCINSLTSSSPPWFTSKLPNSSSINFIHSCFDTLPLLSVSVVSNSCLAASVAIASRFSLSDFSAAGVGVATLETRPGTPLG